MADVVLFLAASPGKHPRLRLDIEQREVEAHLREGHQRDELDLRISPAVRVQDLSRDLLRWRPRIVHFGGHAYEKGLMFESEDGKGTIAPIDALADLFSVVADTVECVLLNACLSDNQAQAISEHIPFVVGTTAKINDKGAIAFAAGFYRGVSFGKDWCTALKLGRTQVDLLSLPGADIVHSYPECP